MATERMSDDQPSRSVGGRVPPHNLEAEEALLGAMLLSRDAVAAASEALGSADAFYRPAHAHIYDVISVITARGDAVDPITVADELRRRDLLEAAGGPSALIALQANAPGTANAAHYARIVRDHALLRRLIGAAGSIAETAYGLPDDVRKAVDQAESLVFDIARHEGEGSTAPIKDLLDASIDRLEELYDRGSAITGTPTGYTDLDEMTSGLQPGALIVVGARPAMGKCLTMTSTIVNPITGSRSTIKELFEAGRRGEDVAVWALDESGALVGARPSVFVDDGIKPVYTVRTRLGREVTTTLSHPFLTFGGWKPLYDLEVGSRIAVPRRLDVFGDQELPEAEVKLLGYLIGDGRLTGTTPRFTAADPQIESEFGASVGALGCDLRLESMSGRARSFRISHRPKQANQITASLRQHGLMGTSSHTKFVPDAVFTLPKHQVAMFLSRLYATDGSAWWSDAGDGYGRISYCSVSKRLIHDVQHLLLRFGLNARIRTKYVKYRDERRIAYELELMAADEIRTFAREIGIFSKEAQVAHLVEMMDTKERGYSRDTLPTEAWDEVVAAKGERSRASVSEATGRPRNHTGPVGKRAPHRDTVAALAIALDDPPPMNRALADVYWDEIVEITYEGPQQVYDLTIPELHNFVADDVCVHNTSFALGMATNAALKSHRPVLVFSLEMSKVELSQRILCSEARVDSRKVRNGRLTDGDWNSIANAVGRLGEAPIWIDDNPNVNVMEIRSKARRLRGEVGDLGMVVVDYIQLMTGRGSAESRQVEVSEISRGLKLLAREIEAPVVACAQLNRGLEQRADKRPMLSDLRESGALEQDADVVMFIYRDEVYEPTQENAGLAEIIVSKHRSGPTGIAHLSFLGHITRFENMARDM